MRMIDARPSAPLLTLDPRHVDVWCTFVDDIDRALLEEYHRLLSDSERLRLERFRFEKDRHQYLATRALVRSTLSRYVATAPAQWTFHADRSGRPAITDPNPDACHLAFNLSHTDGLVVLAVTACTAIGVDAENTVTRDAPLDVATRFFAPEENAALSALPTAARQTRFFEYWTLKESYLKARSLGLSLPLRECVCRFNGPDALEVALDPDSDGGTAWWFCQIALAHTYTIAWCAERHTAHRPHLIVRRAVPLVSESTLHCDVLRWANWPT